MCVCDKENERERERERERAYLSQTEFCHSFEKEIFFPAAQREGRPLTFLTKWLKTFNKLSPIYTSDFEMQILLAFLHSVHLGCQVKMYLPLICYSFAFSATKRRPKMDCENVRVNEPYNKNC